MEQHTEDFLKKLAEEEKNKRRSGEIVCPYCEHEQDSDTKYHHVSYWGEDSKCKETCEHCGKEFYVEEKVIRDFETTTIEWEEKDGKGYDLIERLSDLEHMQWIHWTRYFLENDTIENKLRWNKQALKIYSQLSEEDKEKDRKFARLVIKEFRKFVNEISCSEKETSLNFKVRLINILNLGEQHSSQP